MNKSERIRRSVLATGPMAVVLALLMQTSPDAQSAERILEQSCMGCHVAPDLEFAVDRAWLNQVKSTA